MKNLISIISIAFFFIIVCSVTFTNETKFCGVNWVGTSEVLQPGCYKDLIKISANSVAIIPFAYGELNTGNLTTSASWQWWGESFEGTKELARIAKAEGLKVMIKPQIWFDHGTFTGDVKFDSSDKWLKFENAYQEYLLRHAKNAHLVNADILCIGTELKEFVKIRPHFWKKLIDKIKKVYSGNLTYAGNWDSFKEFPFWKELDFVGVDAYFPLTTVKSPTPDQIKTAWLNYSQQLSSYSDSIGNDIILCEYGFRSKPHNCEKPWESSRSKEVNLIAQRNAYIGTFESIFSEDFIAGGFLWKWYPDHKNVGGEDCNRFTPQNKPAQEVIKKYYSKYSAN